MLTPEMKAQFARDGYLIVLVFSRPLKPQPIVTITCG